LAWRLLGLIIGLAVFIWPVALPIIEVARLPSAWQVWHEFDQIAALLMNTLLVMAGSVFLALLLGGSAAFLLVRTNLPGQRFWMLLLGLGLFIPLPLLLSGWYLVAQSVGFSLPAMWPMAGRLAGAMFLHGVMGISWAALILGLGMLWIEPELEEEASLYGPMSRVLRRVMLPRLWPFVGLAALVVAWPTWHEITVTDFFKVDTLAEEVYLQLNAGTADDVARACAATLPLEVAFVALMLLALRRWQASCPQRWPSLGQIQRLQPGGLRWLTGVWLFFLTALVLLVPLWGLIDKAGMNYGINIAPHWTVGKLCEELVRISQTQWQVLLQSLGLGVACGITVALVVLLFVWLARGSRRTEKLLWWLISLLWSIPGPIVGLGVLAVTLQLLEMPGHQLWSRLLYSEPSPLPNVWVVLIRYFPIAWLVIWPVARLLPCEWDEMAYLDGASPWQRLWRVYWPNLAGAVIWVGLLIGLLSLGEISGSKLITIPGFRPLSHLIFEQLHAAKDTEVAALSLILLIIILLGGALLLMWRPYRHLQRHSSAG
jgi:iron(III) transport system permease protein